MKKQMLFAGACAVALSTLAIAFNDEVVAQAQQVTAGNVTQVDFPVEGHVESLAQTSTGEWLQYGAQGQVRFRFVETGRDATSVYLKDNARNFPIRIDLSDRTLSFQDKNGQKAVFGTITAMSAKPPVVVQQQPTRSLPQASPPPQSTQTQSTRAQSTRAQPAQQGWGSQSPASSTQQQSGWGNQQPQQPAQGGWGNPQTTPRQTQQQPIPVPQPQPWPGNQQQGSTQQPSQQQASGWGNSQQQSQPQQSAPWSGNQGNQQSPSKPPPWTTNSGNNATATNAGQGGFGGQQTSAPVDSFAQYAGVWVETNKRLREQGDGINGPITWDTPRIVTLRKAKNGQVILRYHDNPSWFTPLTKRSDTSYSDGRVTANFSKSGSSYYLQLLGPQGASGNFELSRTADGTFSRERFAKGQDRDSRRSLYNQEGLTKEWNNNFYSYDGVEMDLFNPGRGRKVQIFKQPGDLDYAVDDNMNLGLPWGLRGYRVRSSSSRQTETMITNASTFQDQMSYNFGGGISTPKGSFGASYSREETGGGSSNSSTTKALGIGRIERFALIVDKPNMQLSDNFRRSLDQLIEGRTSPQNIISTYGTHYANAIHYGGLGRAEKDMSSTEIGSYISEKYSASANVGIKGANLSGGFSQGKSSSTNQSSVFTVDEFEAIGGSGSMSLNGWTVQDNDTVPVRYDLRPLSELISPIFFPSDGSSQKAVQQSKARASLAQAITAKMRSVPRLPNRYIGPKIYRVDFKRLYCTNNGDEGSGNAIELYGKISFGYHDDNGVKSITLFNHAESSPKSMRCSSSPSVGTSLTQSALIVLSPNSSQSRQSGFGRYYITDGQLFEDDNSFTDTDDRIRVNQLGQPRIALAASTSQRSGKLTATFGVGASDAPTLKIDYTITELK